MGSVALASAASIALSVSMNIVVRALTNNDVTREGSRLSDVQITSSAEGMAIKRLWGRCRLSGCVIWSTNFKEMVTTTYTDVGGGKGGGSQIENVDYTYTVSFAVAFCEGRDRVSLGRVWADGSLVDLSKLTHRFYPGNDTQLPDHVIEATEGFGDVPAFRGTCYLVFEDIPLADYGNRIPLITAEIIKPVFVEVESAAENNIKSIGLFPFASQTNLGNQIYRSDNGKGVSSTENTTNSRGVPNLQFTVQELKNTFQGLSSVNIPVTWFYNGSNISPRVEANLLEILPVDWRSSNITRQTAQTGTYGYGSGTPSDICVREAIQYVKSQGLSVTIQLNIVAEFFAPQNIPDIYVGVNTINNFGAWNGTNIPIIGSLDSGTYTHFLFHYARLCADLLTINDEFVMGTTLCKSTENQLFVQTLIDAIPQIKSVCPAKISYCADYTEYGATEYPTQLSWPMDTLWNSCDFVSISAMFPLADWRDGTDHLDYTEANGNVYEQSYLQGNVHGGELYTYEYLNGGDRNTQTRTLIVDSFYNKPWIFQQKALKEWQQNTHYTRWNNVEDAASAWVTGSKPIHLLIGCAAVDKAANAPEKLLHPGDKIWLEPDQTLPFYSSGVRDDTAQRSVIEAQLAYWKTNGGTAVPFEKITVQGWDIRPFPEFPGLKKWSDEGYWTRGHWLNGRIGAISISSTIQDICSQVKLTPQDIDVSMLNSRNSQIRGFICEDLKSPRDLLTDLMKTYSIYSVESDGVIMFKFKGSSTEITIEEGSLIQSDSDYTVTRGVSTSLPKTVKLTYYSENTDYQVGSVSAIKSTETSATVATVALPFVLGGDYVKGLGDQMIEEAWEQRNGLEAGLPKSKIALDCGDVVNINIGGVSRKMQIIQSDVGESVAVQALGHDPTIYDATENGSLDSSISDVPVFGKPALFIVDMPMVTGLESVPVSPRVAAFADPWPGAIAIYEVTSNGSYILRSKIAEQSNIGEISWNPDSYIPEAYKTDRWNGLRLIFNPYNVNSSLQSASKDDLLEGANLMAVENMDGDWDLLQYETATPGFEGTNIIGGLTGKLGTNGLMSEGTFPGIDGSRRAVAVRSGLQTAILDTSLVQSDIGRTKTYRYGPASVPPTDPRFTNIDYKIGGVALRPYAPSHLDLKGTKIALYLGQTSTIKASWIRCTRFNGDAWNSGDVPLNEDVERYKVTIEWEDDHRLQEFFIDNSSNFEFSFTQTTELALELRIQQFSTAYGFGSTISARL